MNDFIVRLTDHLITEHDIYETSKGYIGLGFLCGVVFMLIVHVILDIIFSELHFNAEHKRERQHSEEFDCNLSE